MHKKLSNLVFMTTVLFLGFVLLLSDSDAPYFLSVEITSPDPETFVNNEFMVTGTIVLNDNEKNKEITVTDEELTINVTSRLVRLTGNIDDETGDSDSDSDSDLLLPDEEEFANIILFEKDDYPIESIEGNTWKLKFTAKELGVTAYSGKTVIFNLDLEFVSKHDHEIIAYRTLTLYYSSAK